MLTAFPVTGREGNPRLLLGASRRDLRTVSSCFQALHDTHHVMGSEGWLWGVQHTSRRFDTLPANSPLNLAPQGRPQLHIEC